MYTYSAGQKLEKNSSIYGNSTAVLGIYIFEIIGVWNRSLQSGEIKIQKPLFFHYLFLSTMYILLYYVLVVVLGWCLDRNHVSSMYSFENIWHHVIWRKIWGRSFSCLVIPLPLLFGFFQNQKAILVSVCNVPSSKSSNLEAAAVVWPDPNFEDWFLEIKISLLITFRKSMSK